MKANIKKAVSLICAVLMLCPFILTASASYEAPFDNSYYYEEGAYTLHYRVFEAENEKAKAAETTQNCREKCAGCGAAKFGAGVCYE